MRTTQLAEQEFRKALNVVTQLDDDNGKLEGFHEYQGFIFLSVAIREVYNKLEEMDKKIDEPVFGAARGFK